jgi:hypothetical protein
VVPEAKAGNSAIKDAKAKTNRMKKATVFFIFGGALEEGAFILDLSSLNFFCCRTDSWKIPALFVESAKNQVKNQE